MKMTFVAIIVVILALGVAFCATAEVENEQRYAETQMAWVSVAQASVRLYPSKDQSPIAQVKNGTYLVIIGKCSSDGDEYYMVDMMYLGYPGEVGYVLRKSVHLGMKEYVRMTSDTWAYAQESTEADGVAQLSAGQQRLVLGETQVAGESWLAIQVDGEGDRGVGYVRKADVSEKFVDGADEDQLNKIRSRAPILLSKTAEDNRENVAEEFTAANGYVTVSEQASVFSNASATSDVLGTLQPGEKVYIYQVGNTYTMVVFNNAFGYVENAKISK